MQTYVDLTHKLNLFRASLDDPDYTYELILVRDWASSPDVATVWNSYISGAGMGFPGYAAFPLTSESFLDPVVDGVAVKMQSVVVRFTRTAGFTPFTWIALWMALIRTKVSDSTVELLDMIAVPSVDFTPDAILNYETRYVRVERNCTET